MPTARELLEQADALMRRNRVRAADNDIPLLTDAVPEPAPAPVAPPPADTVEARPAVATPAVATPMSLDEVPELTEVVEEIDIPSIVVLPEDEGEPSQWLDVARHANPANGGGETTAVHETQRELPLDAHVAVERARLDEAAAAQIAEAAAKNDARWQAVAADVRLQVLQQAEGFAAGTLLDALDGRMQPIVERARAELAAAIHAEVAELLRAHVAGAIEREIERRRAENG